jgi:hypothetical protein
LAEKWLLCPTTGIKTASFGDVESNRAAKTGIAAFLFAP